MEDGKNLPEEQKKTKKKLSSADKKGIAIVCLLAVVALALAFNIISSLGGRAEPDESVTQSTAVTTQPQTETTTAGTTATPPEASQPQSTTKKDTHQKPSAPQGTTLQKDEKQTLSIEEIAKLCFVTPAYFRRIFREYSGMSPTEYRMRMKIERAKDLMERSEYSVAELSELLGYNDPSYFCRVFKKVTGMNPTDYRRLIAFTR